GCGEEFEFVEMEVAVVLAAGAFVGERVIGEELEADGGDGFKIGGGGDGVGVDVGALAGCEDRKVRLFSQGCAAGGCEGGGVERCPMRGASREGIFPCGYFGLCFCVERRSAGDKLAGI